MVRVFLLTANVGSVFENIDKGLPVWIGEITATIKAKHADFLALHCQETGGKDGNNGNRNIQLFFSTLIDNLSQLGLQLVDGIADTDSEVPHEFTAMSNLYFVRKDMVGKIRMWDFEKRSFSNLNSGGTLLTGNEVPGHPRIRKEKFPKHFFPNCKWSRKGFARTRWDLAGTAFDLINLHLFHDVSNIIAASVFPSPFSQNRQRALNFILEKFRTDDLEKVPIFFFGDFNFRVNTFDIFEKLRNEAALAELQENISTDVSATSTSATDLIIDAKKFSVSDQEKRFKEDWRWLRAYDFESTQFESLKELDIHFHPTYPFHEVDAEKFMRTRCPSWCDRVLFTDDSKLLISSDPSPEYNLIGSNVCMGDHKPVYLTFMLKSTNPVPAVENIDRIESAEPINPESVPGEVGRYGVRSLKKPLVKK